MNYGFRVVISSRFADIFRGNSGKQGLLTAQADQGDVELLWKLLENEPGTEITVDLESRTITAKDVVARFQVDDYTRWRLLEGLDDISLTLRHEDVDHRLRGPPARFPADNSQLSRAREFVCCRNRFRAAAVGPPSDPARQRSSDGPEPARREPAKPLRHMALFARRCWTHVLLGPSVMRSRARARLHDLAGRGVRRN